MKSFFRSLSFLIFINFVATQFLESMDSPASHSELEQLESEQAQKSNPPKSLKERSKEFIKKHKTAIKVTGIVAGVLTALGIGILVRKQVNKPFKPTITYKGDKAEITIKFGTLPANTFKASRVTVDALEGLYLNGEDYEENLSKINNGIVEYNTQAQQTSDEKMRDSLYKQALILEFFKQKINSEHPK